MKTGKKEISKKNDLGILNLFIKKIGFLNKQTTIFGTKLPNLMLLGLAGVICMYIGAAGTISITTPWLVRGDTVQHIDYTWRLYNGNIPKWDDNVTYPPMVELKGQRSQSASANPPIFYMIHAPVIGPILDSGDWKVAMATGRAINIFLGVLCILVLAWAGWLYGGRNKVLLAIAVPAISVMTTRFLRLNYDYALEPLFVLLATLSLILNYKILQKGLERKYVLSLFALSIIGMSTKAPYIVFLAVNLLTVLLSIYIKNSGKLKLRKEMIRGAILCASVLATVVVAIGWFYFLWNYMTSGNLFDPHPKGYTGGREIKSLPDVLTHVRFRKLFYDSLAATTTISVMITSFSVAGYLTFKKGFIKRLYKNKPRFTAVSMAMLSLLGMLIVQIDFAVGIGAINFRYLLPAIFPIALMVSVGLLAFSRARGQLIAFSIFAMGLTAVYALSGPGLAAILHAGLENGIPKLVTILTLLLFAVGSIILSASFYLLTSSNKKSA